MRKLPLLVSSALIVPLLAVLGPSCSTDAVGVEDCRKIEEARCAAAATCQGLFGKLNVTDCERFYRDQCLHGLAASSSPGRLAVQRCVEAIGRAAECSQELGEDASIGDCSELENQDEELVTVCQLIEHPEAMRDCDFLLDLEEEPEEGQGGSGGEAGAAGTSGASGASGSASE